MNPHFGQFQCMRYRDDRDLDRIISSRFESLPCMGGTEDEAEYVPVVKADPRQLKQERTHQASLKENWKLFIDVRADRKRHR